MTDLERSVENYSAAELAQALDQLDLSNVKLQTGEEDGEERVDYASIDFRGPEGELAYRLNIHVEIGKAGVTIVSFILRDFYYGGNLSQVAARRTAVGFEIGEPKASYEDFDGYPEVHAALKTAFEAYLSYLGLSFSGEDETIEEETDEFADELLTVLFLDLQ